MSDTMRYGCFSNRAMLIGALAALSLVGCVRTVTTTGGSSALRKDPAVRTQSGRTEASAVRSQSQPPTLSARDPCAVQLHELCGPLLLYYSINKRLPDTLDDLRAIAGPDPNIAFDCPDSRKTYTYNPKGIFWPNQPGRAVLYDSEPSHLGMRWVVMVDEGEPGAPLITRVLAVPEVRFK